MSDFSPADFLRKSVYPNLDAVEAGLLDGLYPKHLTSSGAYPLTCPACKAKEGFYFPRSGFINCPRKKECGQSTSIWDAMLVCGYSNSEIFSLLCKAAGVEPPKRDRQASPTSTPHGNTEQRIGQTILKITQALAKSNPEPLRQFQSERGYTSQQMASMSLGYYSNAQEVLSLLNGAGFSLEEASARGYVEHDPSRPGEIWSSLAGRVIGYWPHQDGDVRLWGRLPTGQGDKTHPKYRFSSTLKKDIPYLFQNRHPTVLVCVEGTLDAWALQHASIWGCAIGGASVNSSQAQFLMGRGVAEIAHMVDGDNAGWTGAIATIRNCESVGIVTNIIALGAGMDDPDSLLRAGKVDELHRLVERRMNAGLYLALMLRAYLAEPSPNLQAINKVYATADRLTHVSRTVFDKHAALLGPRIDLKHESARLLGSLMSLGLTLDEALATVRRKTGYTISFTQELADG